MRNTNPFDNNMIVIISYYSIDICTMLQTNYSVQ